VLLFVTAVSIWRARCDFAASGDAARWRKAAAPRRHLNSATHAGPGAAALLCRRKDVELSGQFKGAASDVLAVLTKPVDRRLSKILSNVNIEVPPPYAGSLGRWS